MTTTDRIMESLTVLESKSDSRFLAIHGEDEPQVRASIDKVLAERGALKLLNILRDDFIGLSEYWNGGDGNAAVNAAQYSRSVANNAISEIDSFLPRRPTPAPAAPTPGPDYSDIEAEADEAYERATAKYAPTVSPEPDETAVKLLQMAINHCKDCCCARSWKALGISEFTGKDIPEHIVALKEELAVARRDLVSIAAVEKAAEAFVMVDNPFYIYEPHIAVKRLFERIRARLTAPPAKPTKQEIVVAVLGQYVFQTQDLGIKELANEIVVRLDAADKEKCDG